MYSFFDFVANVLGKSGEETKTIRSDKLVKKLRAARVKGLRLRISGSGRGGSQVSKGRPQGVWVASEATLWQALPHLVKG